MLVDELIVIGRVLRRFCKKMILTQRKTNKQKRFNLFEIRSEKKERKSINVVTCRAE